MVRYPGGNFVSGYRWEDGVGPVERAPPPARPGLADRRDQRGRPRRVHDLGRPAGGRADDGGQPRHPRRPGGAATCWSTPTTRAAPQLSDLRRAHGARASRTGSGCGASATRWTARGRSATRPPRSTAGSPPRPPRRCGWSTPRSSWSPAAAPAAACRPSPRGRRPCSSTPTTHVDYISAHAYYEPSTTATSASFLASAVDMDQFIDAVVATADHVGRPSWQPEADQHLLRRVERLVPVSRVQSATATASTGPRRPR